MEDYTTQLYRDYFISQYKDPYSPTSISWNVNRVWFTLLNLLVRCLEKITKILLLT